MSEATKGPWWVQDHRGCAFTVIGAAGEKIVVTCVGDRQKRMADADLIAAAPAMRDALVKIASGLPDERAAHRLSAARQIAKDALTTAGVKTNE